MTARSLLRRQRSCRSVLTRCVSNTTSKPVANRGNVIINASIGNEVHHSYRTRYSNCNHVSSLFRFTRNDSYVLRHPQLSWRFYHRNLRSEAAAKTNSNTLFMLQQHPPALSSSSSSTIWMTALIAAATCLTGSALLMETSLEEDTKTETILPVHQKQSNDGVTSTLQPQVIQATSLAFSPSNDH